MRGFARSPARVAAAGVLLDELVTGDALTGAGLDEAMDGVDAAYYLIHSMEGPAGGAFPEQERRAAEHFARAAQAAGVRRVVYLGGLVPQDGAVSRHLASRLAVEEALLGAAPESIALRASIVIGARSRSFRFLVRLIERLPVLALPAWRGNRTAPIDGRDVLAFLVAAADAPRGARRPLVGHRRAGRHDLRAADPPDRRRDARRPAPARAGLHAHRGGRRRSRRPSPARTRR